MTGFSIFSFEERRWGFLIVRLRKRILRFPGFEDRITHFRKTPFAKNPPSSKNLLSPKNLLSSKNLPSSKNLYFQPAESKTRTYHGRVGSRRTAGWRRTGRRQNGSPRRQPSLVPSKASKTRVLNVSPEARTCEILCKPREEQSDRLTTG